MGLRPIARSRSCTHLGEGPFFTLRIKRPANSGQAFAVSGGKLSATVFGLAKLPGTGMHGLALERPETGGGQIARNAVDGGAVAAIGRDGDVDHRIVEAQRLGGRRADLGVVGQLDDAGVFVGQPQFALRTQHAARFQAADRADLEHVAGRRDDRRRAGEHALHAGMRVGRAADHLHDVRAGIDHAQLELVGIGMLLGRDDMADGEVAQGARRRPRPTSTSRPIAVSLSAMAAASASVSR